MANRLADETSPYLLQHKDNPVDWYPWGEEALDRARREDKPILLSIGYSACHWCHVMERESFEDAATARRMSQDFVCIKVDREERPDVDDLYMEAVQAMTGQGGWPLTVFLDSDAVPFHGGTYFPPEPRQGMPSFGQVMDAVVDAYRNRRDEIENASPQVRDGLGAIGRIEAPEGELTRALLDEANAGLSRTADVNHGGFGGAPKFPPSAVLEFLMARGVTPGGHPTALGHVELTLDRMAAGGIYDHVGGGFARYATDAIWIVPHFEKMLYDNAQLARAYLHGFQVFGHERYRRVCEETLDWALREMRGPEGGFYAALDADSEGVEGRFYVWTEAELEETLAETDLADLTIQQILGYWGVSPAGNFEGKSILFVAGGRGVREPPGLQEAKQALLARRDTRVRPGLDDKRIASWNGLMIAALADAGSVLGRDDYLDAARECAGFVLEEMRDGQDRLLRSYKDGSARILGYLEDHALMLQGLLALYEATFEARWFEASRELAEAMIDRFADEERGGFFTTASDAEQLIARRKDIGDHPLPAGNSAAAYGLLRLAALTGEARYEELAGKTILLFSRPAAEHPDGFGHLLLGLDFLLSPTQELALAGEGEALGELSAIAGRRLRPHLVRAGGPDGTTEPPLMRDRHAVDGKPAAYVCENFACKAPVTDPAELESLLA